MTETETRSVLRASGVALHQIDIQYVTDALIAAMADAWDEGYRAGGMDEAEAPIDPRTENPYRSES